jgi:exodeoxyribonuclease VII large subunit
VGHETDVTLIDFASDKRAPTPTAAAEMAVPVRADLAIEISSLSRRSFACWQRGQEARRTELRSAARALPKLQDLLAIPRQRFDRASAQLPRALRANTHVYDRRLSMIAGRLTVTTLRTQIERGKEKVTQLSASALRCMDLHIKQRKTRLGYVSQLLNAFSYKGVLSRGFALVRDEAGLPLHHAAQVGAGEHLSIEFSDGRIAATAHDTLHGTSPSPKKTAKSTKAAAAPEPKKVQGDLF